MQAKETGTFIIESISCEENKHFSRDGDEYADPASIIVFLQGVFLNHFLRGGDLDPRIELCQKQLFLVFLKLLSPQLCAKSLPHARQKKSIIWLYFIIVKA